MPKPFDKIELAEVKFMGKQPIFDLTIHGVEAQTISDILAKVADETAVLPSKQSDRIRWAQKAYSGAIQCIGILLALGEQGMFPEKH